MKDSENRRYDTVIFDLDGTLLDTLTDLTNSTNAIMEQYGMPGYQEEQIRAFNPEEYWTIDAKLKKSRSTFDAKFHGKKDGKKIEVSDGQTADDIVKALDNATYVVSNVKKGSRKKLLRSLFSGSLFNRLSSGTGSKNGP